MELRHPKLVGLIDWPRYRFVGRCWAEGCGKLMVLHSPWRMFACERTPMAIVLTDKGRQYEELLAAETTAGRGEDAVTDLRTTQAV
jgi:hypothetical protein